MYKDFCRSWDRGVGTLELAACAVVVCLMVLTGLSIGDYISHARFLSGQIDRVLEENNSKPYLVDVNSDGQAVFSLNAPGLATLISELGSNLSQAIEGHAAVLPSAEQFLIQVSFVEVVIDPIDGRVLGLDESQTQTVSLGNYSPPPLADAEENLETGFQSWVSSAQQSQGNGPSTLAHPTGQLGRVGGGNSYLERSVLVGLRAFMAYEGSALGSLFTTLGLEPVISDSKIVFLRGVL